VVAVGVDQVGVHRRRSAPIAEHPLDRAPQWSRRHALGFADEAVQIVVCPFVGGLRED
jgi:hypothetical protein